MPRLPPAPVCLSAVLLGAGLAIAAESSPLLRDPPPLPTTPSAPRLISPTVAAKLAAAAPKFTSASATPSPAPEQEQPRNAIIRLPSYVVRESKIRVPRHERDVLTSKGRFELALHRHPGLKLLPFSNLNRGWALEMLEQEFALERQAEMLGLFSLLPADQRAGLPARFSPSLGFGVPRAASGPWAGLAVPWER